MSDSDDDVPLGQRTAATAPHISKDASKSVHKPDAQPAEAAPRARKPPIIDDSDDDDDQPVQKPAAAKPKPKPKAPAAERKPASDGKAPKSEAERALLKNESIVKREVEQEQAAAEQKQHKQQTKAAAAKMYHNDLAAEKQKPAPKQKGGKAAKDGKPEGGDKVKREKKVYDMPGQTKETPDETDSLRKFYSSLRAQRPDSQMARKWLCQHGLLPQEEAEQLVAELAKEKAAGKPRSPSKPKAKAAATGSAARQKAPPKPPPEKKRKAPPAPKPPRKNRKIAKKDDAFTDGGLVTSPAAAKPAAPRPAAAKPAASDGSDEDDIPLAARASAKA